ncbi:porphobilinogen deaminase [Bordetella sp. H567]|uniref:hydroxymethylbilane synthase n=1 Tax=Bordetella sp. H567 TaxID=1697043 RepID=UPI00081CE53F|nr:hydroxymethylbilane synthase [Bordetella sp. H567]AOB30791.1 porphobilinogen deaminase [Bordetella sp. H567]
MSHPSRLIIATRASRLALWQAEHVRGRLQALYPACSVELLTLTTRGDQILDRTLSKVGGKGLFVKELENALLDGRADLAVHSLKDVPIDLQAPFELCAMLERADPRDAFVSSRYAALRELPDGAVVGTSSLRRESQIRAHYPKLVVRPLRGNLDTRLAKLDAGDYDAIVLAAAGLERLGLASRIRAVLDVDESLPAAGQGALGIEIRADRGDVRGWVAPLASARTTACVAAERAVSRELGGSCQVPLAAYATTDGDTVHLRALVASVDGARMLRAEASGPAAQAGDIGVAVARELLDKGASAILADLSAHD